ncbi:MULTISPECIES: GNAT family N-acetyltransferase [Roseobacteraceae]|jgi:ribosomal protein S18 acetylase RimI-like enzyme|uniref:Acetyltransferase (GNAT) family protein n=1 Tax=Pseudosulfitobacter pseudonitzschiae TaxID=1402135 RepID=A0A221K1C4_9RHOB|nr:MULTISPECIES: GNAT family N-acetyltransferase [Roseobacteraceae]ASM72812.1 acetyltransferase (GNAT) family protein [Pseudosulfitobacter pseudonitzschiae]
MITLSPLPPDDFSRVAHITVHPEQVKFSGTIEQAFAAPEPSMDYHAIQQGPKVVGFFKIDRAYSVIHDFAPPTALGLRAVMVDAVHQGQGIGQALCHALPNYLARLYPKADSLWLTVNVLNAGAVRAYVKGGFIDTGNQWPHGGAGPQHILRLPLHTI